MQDECIFCKNRCEVTKIDIIPYLDVECNNCGRYKISQEAFSDLPNEIEYRIKIKRHMLSGIIRERYENGLHETFIAMNNFNDILSSVNIPKTLHERLDKIILYSYKHLSRVMDEITISPSPAIGYAKDVTEFSQMLHLLKEEGIFTGSRTYSVIFTIKGIEKAEQLLIRPVISNNCFVAMWFEDEVNKIFNDYMLPAIQAKTLNGEMIPNEKSFKAIRIDLKEFNDEILDNIISEIRKSRFVVADFTGNRGGVYYEAGFAYGLNLDVIFTCKRDFFEKEKLHFDVNHKNFLLWENGEDLYKKLRARISATII
jgi:hypothetical protein